jgi:hypothetical protein
MEELQMDNDKLTLGSIIGAGVLVSSLVIGTEPPTSATLIDPELNMNSESAHEIVLEDYPDYLKENYLFSFQHDQITIGLDNYFEDEPPEIEVIETPIIRKVLFQFKKPVDLEFS